MEQIKQGDTTLVRLNGYHELMAASFAGLALQHTFDRPVSQTEKAHGLELSIDAQLIANDVSLHETQQNLDLTPEELRIMQGGARFLMNSLNVRVKKLREGSTPPMLATVNDLQHIELPVSAKK